MRSVSWKKIVIVLFLFLFFTPLLLPDDFSGLEGEEKKIAKFSIAEAETETILIWKYKVVQVNEIRGIPDQLPLGIGPPEKAWDVVLMGYTYFHIPLERIELTVVKDPKAYHAIYSSYKENIPGSIWFILIGLLILYSIPVLVLDYLVKLGHDNSTVGYLLS